MQSFPLWLIKNSYTFDGGIHAMFVIIISCVFVGVCVFVCAFVRVCVYVCVCVCVHALDIENTMQDLQLEWQLLKCPAYSA